MCYKEYIQAAEMKRKQGQEIFDWTKNRVVEDQKKYPNYMEDIIDLYEAFRNYSNSVLKPMTLKIRPWKS